MGRDGIGQDTIEKKVPSFEDLWKSKSTVLIADKVRRSEQKTNINDTNKNWLSILDSAAINDANENSK